MRDKGSPPPWQAPAALVAALAAADLAADDSADAAAAEEQARVFVAGHKEAGLPKEGPLVVAMGLLRPSSLGASGKVPGQ